MKKSLLILSMMAVGVFAYAYDVPAAGTAEAPNYYVIRANRGIPYLAYGKAQQTEVRSYLTRTSDLKEANIWAVTPGTTAGTVTIKNYTANSYLLDFVDSDEEPTVEEKATAITVSKPVDLYLTEKDGAYAISIQPAENASYPHNCISLDAPGGTVDYLGNYIPTSPSSGEGGCFWFYKVNIKDIEASLAAVSKAVEDEVNAAALEAAKAEMQKKKDEINAWIKALMAPVPQVTTELQAGIDAVNAYEYSDSYVADLDAIWNNTLATANKALETCLNGNEYAIKNLRRAAVNPNAVFISVGDNAYAAAENHYSDKSIFKFISTSDGGYTIFNTATSTYLKMDTVEDKDKNQIVIALPTTVAEEAQNFYPALGWGTNYMGLTLSTQADHGGKGLNWNPTKDEELVPYDVADDGSIWSLITYDPISIINEIVKTYEEKYANFIAAVPHVKEVLEKAITDMQALTSVATVTDDVAAIDEKAMADAKTLLATCYADKVVTLKNLRQSVYLEIADGKFARQADATVSGVAFTMKPVEGGYNLFNEASGAYIGKPEAYDFNTFSEGKNMMTVTTEASQAAVVAPALLSNSGFYGAALSLGMTGEEGKESEIAFNMNADSQLWYYFSNDGGSVWSISEYSSTPIDSINEIKAANAVREGIYDLQGRKLSAPVKGINIINGKKVLVK